MRHNQLGPKALKAVKLVADRRVHIIRRDDDVLAARILSDHGEVLTSYDWEGAHCGCVNGQRRQSPTCAHVMALKLAEQALYQGVITPDRVGLE